MIGINTAFKASALAQQLHDTLLIAGYVSEVEQAFQEDRAKQLLHSLAASLGYTIERIGAPAKTEDGA